MKYNTLHENSDRLDINTQTIIDYVNNNRDRTDPHKMNFDQFRVIFNHGVYEIWANELVLLPLDNEFKYPIAACDKISIRGNNIKSFKNLPSDPYQNNSIVYSFAQCDSLNFKEMTINPRVSNTIMISQIRNFDPNDLPYNTRNLRVCTSKGNALHDFEKYNVSFKDMVLQPMQGLKNLPHLLLKEIEKFALQMYGQFYTRNDITTLNTIINTFMSSLNKEEYIMDMTVELINAGYSDEV